MMRCEIRCSHCSGIGVHLRRNTHLLGVKYWRGHRRIGILLSMMHPIVHRRSLLERLILAGRLFFRVICKSFVKQHEGSVRCFSNGNNAANASILEILL
jgi:hypothetical protein